MEVSLKIFCFRCTISCPKVIQLIISVIHMDRKGYSLSVKWHAQCHNLNCSFLQPKHHPFSSLLQLKQPFTLRMSLTYTTHILAEPTCGLVESSIDSSGDGLVWFVKVLMLLQNFRLTDALRSILDTITDLKFLTYLMIVGIMLTINVLLNVYLNVCAIKWKYPRKTNLITINVSNDGQFRLVNETRNDDLMFFQLLGDIEDDRIYSSVFMFVYSVKSVLLSLTIRMMKSLHAWDKMIFLFLVVIMYLTFKRVPTIQLCVENECKVDSVATSWIFGIRVHSISIYRKCQQKSNI